MAAKPPSPSPISTTTPTSKQARSRQAASQPLAEQGRAGSAGGVVLDKGKGTGTKTSTPKAATKAPTTQVVKDPTPEVAAAANKPRRKPRKLNQDSIPVSSKPNATTSPPNATMTDQAATAELDALKARVRGLEAKVEGLYKSNSDPRSARSPRRRGKGRKGSSSKEVPTISSISSNNACAEDVNDTAEEAEEELVRLEDELDSARRDLEFYRPQHRRTVSGETEDVEEIPRENTGSAGKSGNDRQVTLSGSYRIPIPASVSVDDVKTIQSGVSAAQNVARSFLEQRRAAAALRTEHNPSHPPTQPSRPKAKSTDSNLEVSIDSGGAKQSWGEWIGGYSVAISRAVGKIEHEAAMESQRVNPSSTPPKMMRGGARRPPARAKLSSEQVHGLMS